MKKDKIKCVPEKKPDGWFAMRILLNGKPIGYLQWIENTSGSGPNHICRGNRLDMAKGICEKYESALSMCEQVEALIESGEIE